MKNKTVLFVSLGVLLIVVIGGAVVIKNLMQSAVTPQEEEEEQTELPPADASIVVELKAAQDRKSVDLNIDNIPVGTESVEYELSYNTAGGLPKGALGKITLNGKTQEKRNILLGTCSKNTCTYDQGVKSVKLVLRFNSPSGASQFAKDYSLE